MRKRKNFGMIFALSVAGLYLFKQFRARRAAQAAALAAPQTISQSVHPH